MASEELAAVHDLLRGFDLDDLAIAERRAANMRRFIDALAAVGTLRVEPGEAADIVWATNAPELYQLLAGQRGWTPERYEHFLADTWQRLLLAD